MQMAGGIYPHSAVCAKIRAMYGKRLRERDLTALLSKRSVPEIAAYLKGTEAYGRLLSGINEHMVHRGQLEDLLGRELVNQTVRIQHYISGGDESVLSIALLRYERDSILSYIRHLLSGKETTFFFPLNDFVRRHSSLPYEQMTAGRRMEQLPDILSGTAYGALLARAAAQGRLRDYPYLERLFSDAFFDGVLALLSDALPRDEAARVGAFFQVERDFANLSRLLRLKRYYPDADPSAYLLRPGLRIKEPMLARLSAADYDEALALIRGTAYGRYFEEGADDAYYRCSFHDANRTLRSGTPSIAVVTAYLHLKQIEIHNLTNIIEGVRYGQPAGQIRKKLIGYAGEV